jgi:hypothetical protein
VIRELLAELGDGDGSDGRPPQLPFLLVSADRGDAISIRSGAGEVLIAIDDVDDTPVPTVAVTPLEALRISKALLIAAKEAAR